MLDDAGNLFVHSKCACRSSFLWVNPKDLGHLINGNDGALNISYDEGEHWTKNNSESVGTFFVVNIDHQEPYNVYIADNGADGPHNAKKRFCSGNRTDTTLGKVSQKG
jgi:hypothetical protein